MSAKRRHNSVAFAALLLPAGLGLLLSSACGSRPGKLSDAAIIAVSFQGETQPPDARVLLKKRADLDGDQQLETTAVIAYGDTERLVFIKELAGGPRLQRKMDFYLRNPGFYNFTQGVWVRGTAPKAGGTRTVGRIIHRLKQGRIDSKAGPFSVMVEYLTEPPGRGRVEEHLLVFTNFTKSFDSIVALAEHHLLKKYPRVPYEFNKESQLLLFPKDSGYTARLRWNGRELVPWYPGEPLFVYLPIRVTEMKDGKDIVLQIRNDGGPALLSYISLTFPEGAVVTPSGRDPGRLYRPGSSVHRRRGGPMRAQSPLLEATVRGWRPFHRATVHFRLAQADRAGGFTARVVTRTSNENRLSPPDESSVAVSRDQQGYPAYAFSVHDSRSATERAKSPRQGRSQ